MQWYTTERIGPKRSKTPDGYLLCEGVPIARVGEMLYARGEVPVEAGADGIIRITRDEDELFRPETIASFQGKPVCDEHPPTMVSAADWQYYAKGVAMNVRRGENELQDLLLADLLVTDQRVISEIEAGKREISCGYDAAYEPHAPGRGKQRDIVGNHIALVTKGRCGPVCAIGDHAMTATNSTVADRLRHAFNAKDAAAFDRAMQDMGAPMPGAQTMTTGGTDPTNHRIIVNVHGTGASGSAGVPDASPGAAPAPGGITPAPNADPMQQLIGLVTQMCQKVDGLVSLLTEEEGSEEDPDNNFQNASQNGPDPDIGANGEKKTDEKMGDKDPVGDEDPKLTHAEPTRKMGEPMGTTGLPITDSAALADAWQETLSMAEILCPGIQVPTFDAKSPATSTRDMICTIQRNALREAAKKADMRTAMTAILGGDAATNEVLSAQPLVHVTCDALGAVFRSAAMLAKTNLHAHRVAPVNITYGTRDGSTTTPKTPAAINKRNADFWAARGVQK